MAPVSAIQSDPVGSGERGGLLACPANSARFAVVVEGLESEVDAAGALEEDASTAAFAFCLLLLPPLERFLPAYSAVLAFAAVEVLCLLT